ncbi:MAG: hypothetical protein IPO41_13805 [Acidobacteria bacterium]|nr:hypothetical protein [Acidobacteriota bacterium]
MSRSIAYVRFDRDQKGTETEATIDDIRKVYFKNISGDITVRNATNGVTALTYEGDVTVEGSTGAINLETTSGNITAFSDLAR